MKRLILLLLLVPALAVAALGEFETPQQEARYRALSQQLRCLVCQGQSIADSDADLAKDLKREVRRMILEGRTDAEIKDFMVARYGDFVLYKPPVKASTYLLWFGPFVLLIGGLVTWSVLARRQRLAAGRRARTPEADIGRRRPSGRRMITFWIACAVMLLAALALVLRPLLAARPLPALDQQEANVAVFRRRLAELEAEQAAGLLTEADAAEARLELERQLLGDAASDPTQPLRYRPSYKTAAVVGVALPVAVLALYLQMGSPRVPDALPSQDVQSQLAFIQEHLAELEQQVRAEPDNLEALLMLGRAYVVLQRYDEAVELYAAAQPRFGGQPALLVDQAEALGYAQGGNLLGQPAALLDQALALAPAFPKGLWLAGLAAMQAEDPAQARQHWQRLLAELPADSEAAGQVRELLAELGGASADSAGPAASLQVEVQLAPALAQRVAPGSTVFVLARPAGGEQRAPLAVVRRTVDELPLAVTLDESMAMVPGMSLREFPDVVVEARVSLSGAAASQAGDLIGLSAPVRVGDAQRVSIVIDRVVE